MKKNQVIILIIIAVAIVATAAIFGYANINDENGVQVASTMVPETTEQVTNKETTTSNTTTNPTVVPEQPAQMVTDADTGKIYFVGGTTNALRLALEGDLQWRLDAAIMNSNVYDCVRLGDQVVNNGKEITSVYGLGGAMPESVTIIRDGYAIMVYSEEDFKVEESYKNSFSAAADNRFTEEVYCHAHNAIKSILNVGYTNAREFSSDGFRGFRGTFATKKLDLFDAWVLVSRSIELNGERITAYTWVLNTCGCGNQVDGGNGGNGGHVTPTAEPSTAPTQEPTVEPTQAPTQTPTQEPTAEPTQAPTQTPTQEPTAAPTQAPTQAPTRVPTQAPTQAPTPAPTAENNNPRPTGENNDMEPSQPTPKPTTTPNGGEVPPTVRPSAKPSDGGWHDDLPKVNDEF